MTVDTTSRLPVAADMLDPVGRDVEDAPLEFKNGRPPDTDAGFGAI